MPHLGIQAQAHRCIKSKLSMPLGSNTPFQALPSGIQTWALPSGIQTQALLSSIRTRALLSSIQIHPMPTGIQIKALLSGTLFSGIQTQADLLMPMRTYIMHMEVTRHSDSSQVSHLCISSLLSRNT